jgi:hypothetical protein
LLRSIRTRQCEFSHYRVTQFYGWRGQCRQIVVGAQDNGTICFDPLAGTEHWKTIFGGGWCAADPTDPNLFYGESI